MAQPYGSLSGGWRMRCRLAGVLVRPADLVLLDEPTNYLDLAGIVWLERYLQHHVSEVRGSTIVLVSHDRTFLDRACNELVVLRDRRLAYFRGTISQYDDDREERRLYMTRMAAAIERQREHLQRTIAENVRQGRKTGDQNRLRQAKSRQKRVVERTGMQVNEKGFRFKMSRDAGGESILSGSVPLPPSLHRLRSQRETATV